MARLPKLKSENKERTILLKMQRTIMARVQVKSRNMAQHIRSLTKKQRAEKRLQKMKLKRKKSATHGLAI